jgi:hypothetical protein
LSLNEVRGAETWTDSGESDSGQNAGAAILRTRSEFGGASIEGAIAVRRDLGSVPDAAVFVGSLEHLDVDSGDAHHCRVVFKVDAPSQQVDDIGDVQVDIKGGRASHGNAGLDRTQGGSCIAHGVRIDADGSFGRPLGCVSRSAQQAGSRQRHRHSHCDRQGGPPQLFHHRALISGFSFNP